MRILPQVKHVNCTIVACKCSQDLMYGLFVIARVPGTVGCIQKWRNVRPLACRECRRTYTQTCLQLHLHMT